MILEKSVARQNTVPFALLLIQMVLALFVVFEFLAIIGFAFNPLTRELSFGLSTNPLEYFFLALSAGMLYLVFSSSTKKFEEVFVAANIFPFVMKNTASHKLWLARHEPKAAALLLIQLTLMATIALAVFAYLDPDIAIVQWQNIGIQPPLTTVLNITIFLIVVAALYYLYEFTQPYRIATKKK